MSIIGQGKFKIQRGWMCMLARRFSEWSNSVVAGGWGT